MSVIAITVAGIAGYLLIAGVFWSLGLDSRNEALFLALVWPVVVVVAGALAVTVGSFYLPTWIVERRRQKGGDK